MINLLPKINKEEIISEQRKRLIIVFCFLLLYFFIFFIISLFLIKFYLNSRTEPQTKYLEEKKENLEKKETKEMQDKIKDVNFILKNIDDFYTQKIYYTDIIEKVSKTIPNNIEIANVSINKLKIEDSETISVSINGSSPNIESLMMFRDNLKKEESFKDLYIPQSNWINPKNFSIFFKLI